MWYIPALKCNLQRVPNTAQEIQTTLVHKQFSNISLVSTHYKILYYKNPPAKHTYRLMLFMC